MVSTLSSMKRTSGSTSGFQTSSSPPGFRNLISNGDMSIAQRGTSFVSPSSQDYTLDRWSWHHTGGCAVTITQDTDVPTGEGFINSLKIDCTTADTQDAGDLGYLRYVVEDKDFDRCYFGTANAKAVTLSFWMKSDNKTGTMCLSCQNMGAYNDSYVAEITVSDNNWNKYTVSLTGPSSGTWTHLLMTFGLTIGSTYQGASAGTWLGLGSKLATSNQTNFLDNTANNILITGVQLEVGSSATDFEHVPWDYQLSRCQRYYWKTFAYATAPGNNVGFLGSLRGRGICVDADEPWVDVRFPVAMRTTPTVTSYNWGTGTAGEWASSGDVADSGARPTNFNDNGGQIDNTDAAAAANDTWNIHAAADAEL